MTKLLTPITIGRNTFKNRVVMAPMCMFYEKTKDGILTDYHFDHYVSRALGGVGGIIVEATMINKNGGIKKVDLGLYNEEQKDAFKKLVDRVHKYNCVIGIQLSHAGRKADSLYKEVIGSSDIPYGDMKKPKALTKDEIKTLVKEFTNSAKLAKEAGFDFVEIHGAHGYLVSQFLSPLSNNRKDEYGGSVENRYRFLGEILKSIKENVDIDVHVRISANEYGEGGNSIEDIIKILKFAKEDGVVFNDISSGGLVPNPPKEIFPGYQALLSKKIKESGLICSSVGLLYDFSICEYLLQSETCDMIYQGRALLQNPNFVYAFATKFKELEKIDFPLNSYKSIKY